MNKHIRSLLLIWIFLGSTIAFAQKKEISDAEAHIRQGDSKGLSKYFSETVELNFDGKKQNYSRNQAEFVMKDFFGKNPPIDGFENYHRGNNSGVSYSISKYASQNGSYRVFMKVKVHQGKYMIDALDFTLIKE
ncbi:MAG: DUF4783 domain-containing protein [Raineya sp.]|jgi:hypothetical protein|nr:DUF4783 domain-containing protein [Raineya sp.]